MHKLALLVFSAVALTGCNFHDHSKDTATRCVRVIGSNLCQNDESPSEYTNRGAPGVNTSYTAPHQ